MSELSSRTWLAITVGFLALATLAIFLLTGSGDKGRTAEITPLVVCVDSTVSTDKVRESYLPDLRRIATSAAGKQAPFYAAACGQNATGKVDWPVHKRFDHGSYEGDLAAESTEHQLQPIEEKLEGLVKESSVLGGTPLGEMLAVVARQCKNLGGGCSIYLFTDGEWADGILHLPREAITDEVEAHYLDLYDGQIDDLAGTVVNFVGVGYGTEIGELRLNEAREIAEALVDAAGGEMGDWTTRL